MPGRDGTGPMGQGAMTGKGIGYCVGNNASRKLGLSYRRGCNKFISTESESQNELLHNRLNTISQQIEDLKESIKQQG